MSTPPIHDLITTAMPLCAHLRMVGVSQDDQATVLALDWAPELCTTGGVLHGGVLMALADAAGAACAFAALPKGAAGTTTVNSATNFLGAVRSGRVTATARVVHAGSTTIVVQTDLTRDDGKLVATTTQTQLVLRG
jgi:1,4-dihydroxy-2-naphthoyl-CoA hydrolase